MSIPSPKVLLIEDNSELAQLIGHMLQRGQISSFSCICLDRLETAIQRLRLGDITAAVLDLGLPDSSGLGSLSRLCSEFPDLPIVVLTALEDETVALEALREGAQDYLLKSEISCNAVVRSIRFAIERKQGEQANSRLAAIFECSQDAIIGMNFDGSIVSWNPGAERMFGYKHEEVFGKSIGVIGRGDAPDEMPLILAWLKRGESVKDFETVRYSKDGRMIHVALSVSAVKGSTGKIVGASIIARDIEERVRAEKQRDTLFRQLQASLAEVQLLNGLLPICASCKKVRDDQGYWTQVEVYVHERTNAEFTHGICPECAKIYRAAMPKQL
jgi:PAS domain S-box-containing protein